MGAGEAASKQGRTLVSVPTVPTSVSVTAENDGSLQVSWGEPDDTSGLSISTYRILWVATSGMSADRS